MTVRPFCEEKEKRPSNIKMSLNPSLDSKKHRKTFFKKPPLQSNDDLASMEANAEFDTTKMALTDSNH